MYNAHRYMYFRGSYESRVHQSKFVTSLYKLYMLPDIMYRKVHNVITCYYTSSFRKQHRLSPPVWPTNDSQLGDSEFESWPGLKIFDQAFPFWGG
jgi:hypothetical protein